MNKFYSSKLLIKLKLRLDSKIFQINSFSFSNDKISFFVKNTFELLFFSSKQDSKFLNAIEIYIVFEFLFPGKCKEIYR